MLVGEQETWAASPHLHRVRNPRLKRERDRLYPPNGKCKFAYLGCHLAKTTTDFQYATLKRKFYHPIVLKTFYLHVFKQNDQTNLFEQVNEGGHEFLGKSELGVALQGCIKIQLSPNSQLLEDATWTWVKPM